jgi:hypothetical protein
MNEVEKISFASEPMKAVFLRKAKFLAKWDEVVDDSSQMDEMINCLLTITGTRHAGSSHRVMTSLIQPRNSYLRQCAALSCEFIASALGCRLMWKRFAAVIPRSGRARFCYASEIWYLWIKMKAFDGDCLQSGLISVEEALFFTQHDLVDEIPDEDAESLTLWFRAFISFPSDALQRMFLPCNMRAREISSLLLP